MRTLSLDLRERIIASYDKGEGSRQEIADRYRVSLGMVKKLLQQRKRTGEIAPRHQFSGRKPMIVAAHQRRLQSLLSQKPDLTLKELREAVELKCSLPAIHYALEAMGLTYKKRHSELANKTAPTSRGRAKRGADDNSVGIRPDSSSSTNRARRPT
jgi:transposase